MAVFVQGPEGEMIILEPGASAEEQAAAMRGGERAAQAQREREAWVREEARRTGEQERFIAQRMGPAPQRPTTTRTTTTTTTRTEVPRAQPISPEEFEERFGDQYTTAEALTFPIRALTGLLGAISNALTGAAGIIQEEVSPEEREGEIVTGEAMVQRHGNYGQFITISALAAKLIAEAAVAVAAGYAAYRAAEIYEEAAVADPNLTEEEMNILAEYIVADLVANGFMDWVAEEAIRRNAKDERDLEKITEEGIENVLTEERIREILGRTAEEQAARGPPRKKPRWRWIRDHLFEIVLVQNAIQATVMAVFIAEEFMQQTSFVKGRISSETESMFYTARGLVQSADNALKNGDVELARQNIDALSETLDSIEDFINDHGEFAVAGRAELNRLRIEEGRLMDTFNSMFVAYPTRGVVVKVNDGDTFVLDTGDSVRIKGIEAPERGFTGPPPQNYTWSECTHALEGLIIGQEVILEVDPNEPRDGFGRILAYVIRASDGLDVGSWMIENGYARVRGSGYGQAETERTREEIAEELRRKTLDLSAQLVGLAMGISRRQFEQIRPPNFTEMGDNMARAARDLARGTGGSIREIESNLRGIKSAMSRLERGGLRIPTSITDRIGEIEELIKEYKAVM